MTTSWLAPFLAFLLVLPPQAPAPRRPDAAAAIRHLLKTQKENGAWVSDEYGLGSPGHKVAITAVVANAILTAPPGPEVLQAVRRARGFLAGCVADLGQAPVFHDQFDFSPWGPAYGLLHLRGVQERWPRKEAAPDLKPLVEAFVAHAARMQKPCGGWSYLAKARDGAQPFLTAVMTDGLLQWRQDVKVDAALLERALGDLQKSADRKGSFCYSHEGKHEAVTGGRDWWSPVEAAGRSVQAQLVLVEGGKAPRASLQEPLDRLFQAREEYVKTRNSHAHADPHKIAGYYYYHSLYYAARALRRLGADAKGYVPKIVETLAKEQGSDGSWEDAPCGGKPYGTALGLLTLGALEGTLFPWLESAEAALEEGKAGGRPVLCFFADAGRDSADLERVLVGEELRATVGGFTCLKSAVRKEDPACRKAGVTSGPVVLVLDAREAEPWAKPLARLRGRRTAKVLQDELGRALEAFRGK